MFPRKTEEFLGGNRPRSSIELEVGKTTRKNCSLPQSRRPLMQAVQCINESLGASAVDGTSPMPSSITQDWVPSRADIKKLVKRESTVKVYDAKWQIFRRWADQRKIDPIQATPQIVADFLTFLFSVKKCQVSTIKGYRSTISNTLKYKTGYDFGSHPVLSELIKSFAIQRPVDRPLAPKWDLAFVLSHMCKAHSIYQLRQFPCHSGYG